MTGKKLLDICRNLLILVATGYTVSLIWNWSWIFALLAVIPVYIIMLNIIGFLTIPLYAITPENRRMAKVWKDFQSGDVDSLRRWSESRRRENGSSPAPKGESAPAVV